MRIARELLEEIVAHSRDDLPNECCGLVAARDGEATSVHRVRNEFANPFSYMLDPKQQLQVMNEIESRGEQLGAIYHSHTHSEAYPSQTDINAAEWWPDPLYLICSLADPDEPVVRAFTIRDGQVDEVELEVP